MEEIQSFFVGLFGINVTTITLLQMLARSLVIFFLGIFLVRYGKKRFVGKMTAFDFVLAIMVGSLLSRAITNEKYFLEILAATFLLITLHRLASFAAFKSSRSAKLIKGSESILVHNGLINWEEMRKSNLSEQDLLQALRLGTSKDDLQKVKTATLERNGDISFVLK